MKYLRIEEVISHHDFVIEKDGGLAGIRDLGLLSSAISIPAASFGGKEMHPTTTEKACAYLYHIIKNHPFNDGNKRTSVLCFFDFLDINGINVEFDQDLIYLAAIDVADNKINKTELIDLMNQFLGTVSFGKSKT